MGGCSLGSFYVRNTVSENCLRECPSPSRLRFGSGETLKRIVRDTYPRLEESLGDLGVTEISSPFESKSRTVVPIRRFLGGFLLQMKVRI
jgi:hypothetical protein